MLSFNILAILVLILFLHITYVLSLHRQQIESFEYRNYTQIKHSLKSGDLILFRHYSFSWPSILQMYVYQSPFTHVGIVYLKDGTPYVLEAHPHHYLSSRSAKREGIMLYPLEQRLRTYRGQLFIRPAKFTLSLPQQQRFDYFVDHYQHYDYFPSLIELCVNYLSRCIFRKSLKRPIPVNCAEMVAYILKYVLQSDYQDCPSCDNPGFLSRNKLYGGIYRI